MKKPNILFVFADQWRADAFGYTGNPDVKTPNIDEFAKKSCQFTNAISNCPVCSPYRASLLTGKRPLAHGVFLNDVPIDQNLPGFGTYFKGAGYHTGYIGKWHVDGHGREEYIPKERRLGFDYWKVCECSHEYLHSPYYEGENTTKQYWIGYDASAQTDDAIEFMERHVNDDALKNESEPFLLFLSWGPPHGPPPYMLDSPYDQYPQELGGLYVQKNLTLRPNVPQEAKDKTRELLAGYYSHCSALDRCFGRLVNYLQKSGLIENTILVFTSDHGDMLGSQGIWKKQSPFEESIRVPLLIQFPRTFKIETGQYGNAIIGPHDILPTLMGSIGIPYGGNFDGHDYSKYLVKMEEVTNDAELIALYQPGGQWRRGKDGGPLGYSGREYRGIRTNRYTYVRDLSGPWLLFDNQEDPFQMYNLIDSVQHEEIINLLEERLKELLLESKDEFLSGTELIGRYGYNEEFARVINPLSVELCLENWGYDRE